MRFLVKATLPNEAGNALVRNPNMASQMEAVMGDLRPKAAYFTIDQGQRTAYFVVNMESATDLPRIAEPLWLSWKADVTVSPVFLPEEMEAAMPAIGEIIKKY